MAETIELTIDALSYGGRGVGRHDGKAVFVPAVMPGERILCRVIKAKKRYCEAELVEVLQSSAERREPPCRFFPECGGCQWQHLPYPLQAEWKQRIFNDTLQRATGCDAAQQLPIITAPTEMGYRCRTQIKCAMTSRGLIAGFYRPGSHSIVDVDSCSVLDPLIVPLLERFRSSVDSFAQADKISQIDFCVDASSHISIVVHFTGRDADGLGRRLSTLDTDPDLSVYLQGHRKAGLTTVVAGPVQTIRPEEDGELQLTYPPGGFIQINLRQNQRLVREVVGEAIQTGDERILDLYSGVGNFSLPLARRCREVVGVEGYAPGVRSAICNASNNRLDNVSFIAGKTEDVIRKLCNTERFDTIVLDPPRSGAAAAIESLLLMQPERIVYVSCDPTTLARDLATLIAGGYRLQSARAVDMFPQTWHIEGIAVLVRSATAASLN